MADVPKKRPHGRKMVNKGATQRGTPLTQMQKELVIQSYALCGNKAMVARQLRMSYSTIQNVLKETESNIALQQARKRALEDVAGRVHGRTVEILDSIGPQDLESGLIKGFDQQGNLKTVKSYGPSLMQKVTSAAILTDKMKVIEDTKQAVVSGNAHDVGSLPMPGDIQSALHMIGERVKRLRIIDVQLADKNPDLVSAIQDVAHRASLNDNIVEADYEDLDFDNPSTTGET